MVKVILQRLWLRCLYLFLPPLLFVSLTLGARKCLKVNSLLQEVIVTQELVDTLLHLFATNILTNIVKFLQEWNTLKVSRYPRLDHVFTQKRYSIRVRNLVVAKWINRLEQVIHLALRSHEVEAGELHVLLQELGWAIQAYLVHDVEELLELVIVKVS